MSACTHDLTEREVACAADGMCPMCLAARIRELEAALSERENAVRIARSGWDGADAECERLRALLDAARAETHFQACLVRDLLPYQDRAVKAEVDLARVTEERDKARREALESAARVCDERRGPIEIYNHAYPAMLDCAAAIRALIEEPRT